MTLLDGIDADIRAILMRAIEGETISWQDALKLCDTTGKEFHAVVLAADELRRSQVGEIVTYVINRNVNFTNVCVKHCGFCAFSRTYRSEQGYLLPLEEILRRIQEAADMGATEVCVQAGLPPDLDGSFYVDLTTAVKKSFPAIHIHAFSPEEVLYGAVRSGTTIRDYLTALRSAGLGSLPGTSAEILDQEIRDVISPGRITVKQWIDVITTAHDLGIPTTSTIMYGHMETPLTSDLVGIDVPTAAPRGLAFPIYSLPSRWKSVAADSGSDAEEPARSLSASSSPVTIRKKKKKRTMVRTPAQLNGQPTGCAAKPTD